MNIKTSVVNLARRAMALSWVDFPVTVMKRFGADYGGLFAAGLAFFMLLSFPPLLLTGAAVMAFFIHDPAVAAAKVSQIVRSLFPNGGAQSEINHFLTQRIDLRGQVTSLVRGRTIAGLIGFLTLLWTAIQIFVNASTAMNAAFEVKEHRPWIALRGIALGLVFVSGILVSMTLFLSAAPPAVSHFRDAHPELTAPLWLLTPLFELIALVINAALYTVIFKFLPAADVGWKSAFVGGATASVFWEIAKKGLASFLLRANPTLYGELANLILFVLWIYYSMMILLIGAEVAAVHQKLARQGVGPHNRRASVALSHGHHRPTGPPAQARRNRRSPPGSRRPRRTAGA